MPSSEKLWKFSPTRTTNDKSGEFLGNSGEDPEPGSPELFPTMSSPKKTRNRVKVPAVAEPVPIRFSLTHHPAHEVLVAGSFNNWEPTRLKLADPEESNWEIELALPTGSYEYLFVVDGRWLTDPTNPHSVPNPFGGNNSIVDVGTPKNP